MGTPEGISFGKLPESDSTLACKFTPDRNSEKEGPVISLNLPNFAASSIQLAYHLALDGHLRIRHIETPVDPHFSIAVLPEEMK